MAFGQFKTNITFYCPTKGSVSSLKKLKDKILKNSDSVRQRHCLRLSEQTGGGRIPPSLAHLGLLQSLKYTQKRQTYCGLLKYYSQHPLQKGQRLGASWPRCKMIVVAPWWPMMHWFWDLVNQSTKRPLQLLHWSQKQPFSQKYHQNLLHWYLHA